MSEHHVKQLSFSSPPVIEVAISVQFETLPALLIPQGGLLWYRFRNRFPRLEQKAPLDPIIERLGVPSDRQHRAQLQFLESSPTPRLWFVDESGGELIQIQQDRFCRNWRKASSADEYPSYSTHVRPKFKENFNEFCKFLADEKIGELRPNQCEISYVNHIVAGNGWSEHSELSAILKLWDGSFNKSLGTSLEEVRIQVRNLIYDTDNNFIGRLYIDVVPAFLKKHNVPIYILNLTARGKPISENIEGVFGFLDLGHRHIIESFKAITTKKMHELWGKTDV